MMSLGPITEGSNLTEPLLVERATAAFSMPAVVISLRSMLCTQEAQVIPSICEAGQEERGGGGKREKVR